jgi:transposase-like protein
MKSYSPERKAAILKKLLPPLNMSVAELSRQENISNVTLYTWRKQLRERGHVVPGSQSSPEQWSAEAKVAVVVETATLSEIELSEYCRKKGLFPEQVKAWKQACIAGQQSAVVQRQADHEQSRQAQKRIRALEKELHRKERALAEAAALLVLRKKLNAFWDEKNDADD